MTLEKVGMSLLGLLLAGALMTGLALCSADRRVEQARVEGSPPAGTTASGYPYWYEEIDGNTCLFVGLSSRGNPAVHCWGEPPRTGR